MIILETFKDPPPASLSSSSFQSWHWECLNCFVFFVLSGPCFDRESTPYQFPNLTYPSGAAQMRSPPENLPWASSNPIVAPSLFKCPSPPTGPNIFCLNEYMRLPSSVHPSVLSGSGTHSQELLWYFPKFLGQGLLRP